MFRAGICVSPSKNSEPPILRQMIGFVRSPPDLPAQLEPAMVRLAKTPPIDPEFLPAALEVDPEPRSPAPWAPILLICALFAAVVSLAFFGRLADYVDVPGRFQAVGRTQVVEPAATGRVLAILAKDSDRVAKGDVVVKLDPTEADAGRQTLLVEIDELQARMARERAETAAVSTALSAAPPAIVWKTLTTEAARTREARVYTANVDALRSNLVVLDAQRKAAVTTRDSAGAEIKAQEALLIVTKEMLSMTQQLEQKGFNSKVQMLKAQEQVDQQDTQLSKYKTALAEAEAAIAVIDAQAQKLRDSFGATAAKGLAADDRSLDDLEQSLIKAEKAVADMTLHAPIAGVVHNSAVTTVGQIVGAGAQVMEIVPENEKLEIVGYVASSDVGFLKVGQRVEIEVNTFQYTTYGSIPGVISYIGRDALPLPTSKNTAGSSTLNGDIASSTAAQNTSSIVFPITVRADRDTMNIDGRVVRMRAGMGVTIDALSEERRALDYIWSPIVNLFSTAVHEQ